MPTVRVNGESYDYAWWGAGSARAPVVLVHEVAGHARGWGELPQRLAEATGRRVYAYSRIGWGASDGQPRPPERGDVEREALDVVPALRSALKLGRAVIAGFRDGAAVALIHAGAAASPTEAVVAISPVVFVDEPLRRVLRAQLERGLPASITSMPSDPARTLAAWTQLWTSDRFASWNLDDFARGIACPALALRGALDTHTSPAHLARLSTLVRHLETIELPGGRHQPHLDTPSAVVSAITTFLHDVP